jgi:tetratricopeptide (TPR) repeat protein
MLLQCHIILNDMIFASLISESKGRYLIRQALFHRALQTFLKCILNLTVFELNIYIISGYFNEGLNIVDEVQDWLKKYSGRINKSEELKVIYSIAYLYFGEGDLSRSLYWLNKILNDKSENRLDYKAFARIMNLIIHYELENYDLMEYEYKSLKRYLTKKDKLYEYENLIIKTLIKLPDINDKKERIFQLELLKKEIVSKLNQSEGSDKKALDYFDILSWIESRIQSKSFSDIIKSSSRIKLSDLNF